MSLRFVLIIFIIIAPGPEHGNCTFAGHCTCGQHYVGDRCHIPCVHGENVNGKCECDAQCYHGIGCHLECAGHGHCGATGACECNFYDGYTGEHCDIPSCPGWPEPCEGHGDCLATGQCLCNPGYHGSACEILDCPGNPDCNGVDAVCTVVGEELGPRCVNCSAPYMGDACESQ